MAPREVPQELERGVPPRLQELPGQIAAQLVSQLASGRVAARPIALHRVRPTPLAWWWAFWVSPVLLWVVRTTSSETWLHAMLAEIASYACSAAAAVLAVVVVRRMDARLVELARRVGAHAAAAL